MPERARKDFVAGFFGILAFLVGLGLIGWSFWLAYQLFVVPPSMVLTQGPDKPIDVNQTVNALFNLLVKVLLLLVMAAFGSMIATRGIKLYGAKLPHIPLFQKKQEEPAAKSEPEEA